MASIPSKVRIAMVLGGAMVIALVFGVLASGLHTLDEFAANRLQRPPGVGPTAITPASSPAGATSP